MTLWRFTQREVRRRPGRATLTLLSIAIGMGAVVSVFLASNTTRRSYQEMYEMITGRAALEVTADGGGVFDEKLAEELRHVPGVKAAVPSIQRFTVLYFEHKRFQLIMMGIDPDRDRETRDYEVREGSFFRQGDWQEDEIPVLLEIGFARGAKIKLKDEVKLLTHRSSRPVVRARVVGLLAPVGAAGFNKGGAVFMPLATAEPYYARRGQISVVDLVLDPSADEQAVARRVKEALPAGMEVHPPASRTQTARESMVNIDFGLGFATSLMLLLAAFIIINTFLMNVSERRRQLAILRAVGATRRQVIGMLLVEGLVMGVVGTVLGCLAGVGGGYLLMKMISRFFVGSPPPMCFTVWPFVIAGLMGPLLAVLAAAIPALLATRISPLEAMQPLVSQGRWHVPRPVTYAGMAITAVSAGLLAATLTGWIRAGYSVPFGVVLMAGFVLLIPLVIGPLVRAVAWGLVPVVRLEARLAHRETLRRPMRTALTIGVLYIAVATGIGLGTTIISNIQDVKNWHRKTVVADFFVRAMLPDTVTGATAKVPSSIGEEIRHIPGVTSVDSVAFLLTDVAGRRVFVVPREFTDKDVLPLDLWNADEEEVREQLREGEVVIGTVLARRADLKVGDTITIAGKPLRIAALAVDYLVGGYIVYMQRSLADRLFKIEGSDAYLIRVAPAARADVEARLREITERNGLMLQSLSEVSAMITAIMDRVVSGLWVLLVLCFVVAAFGIANTLTMSVLEQTRELALLRVVAMTRRQVRRMVLSQAAIIGLIGLLLGIPGGIFTSYLICLSTIPLLGYPVHFTIQPDLLVATFVIVFGLVLVAAWFPARRAARLNLLIALQYE